MAARIVALLMYFSITVSISLENRNVSTELSSYQITTIVNDITAVADIVWNTKSVNTVGWTSTGDTCKLFSSKLDLNF